MRLWNNAWRHPDGVASLRLGIPIHGRATWKRLREEFDDGDLWPDSRRKLEQAERHYKLARALEHAGDKGAAVEEAMLGLSHLARSRLLSHGVFPRSRPELAVQLQRIGEGALAEALSQGGDEAAPLLVALEKQVSAQPNTPGE